jgi:hypothetical protein
VASNKTPAAYALVAGVVVLFVIMVSRGGSRDADTCAPARRLESGSCCPAWHYASERDGCLLRPWNRPSVEDGQGHQVAALAATMTSDGRMALVWEQVSGPLLTTVRIAEERGDGGWRLLKPADALVGHAQQCAIAAGLEGTVAVAWRQVAAPHSAIMRATRADDGEWSLPDEAVAALSPPPAAYLPAVAFAGAEALVVWGQQGPERVSATVATPEARHSVLSPPMFFANDVLAAGNERGDAIVSWYQSAGADLRVFVSERRSGGDWSRPRADQHLSPAANAPEGRHGRYLGASRPAIAASGAAAVVWAQPDPDGEVRLMLATRSADGAWRSPRDRNDTFSAGAGLVTQPSLAFTPSGDLYVVWRHVHAKRQSVYLAHRLADGRWTASGREPLLLSEPGVEVMDPVMATGADGGVVVAWSERRGAESWAVVVRRSSSASRGWEPARWLPSEQVSPPGGDALRLVAAIGGQADRCVVAWIQQGRVLYATVD